MFDIDYIHGDSLVKEHSNSLEARSINYTYDALVNDYPKIEKFELSFWKERPVYRFIENDEKYLVDAQSGNRLQNLTKEQAIETAQYHYTGSGEVASSKLIDKNPPFELSSRHLPAWQIEFSDLGSPRLYISAIDGKLVSKRHDYWVLFDCCLLYTSPSPRD